ncbi:MAG: nitroreductase family protein [Clostridia bacterium]|jgi:nitroreductase
MDLLEGIKSRRSVRRYDMERTVEDEVIRKIIEYAGWAPSANNGQPWNFIVFRDPEKKRRIAERSRWAKFLPEVPVGIVVVTEFSRAREVKEEKALRYFSIQDSAAAIQNLLLAAWAFGLGTCWIGDFDEEQLRDMFDIPEGHNAVGIIALGYPHPEWKGTPRPRKPVDEILHFEKFNQSL